MRSEFAGFVDERLEVCCAMLRNDDEKYLEKFERVRELRLQLNGLSISKADMMFLQEYFQPAFEQAATEQPAMYKLGMADGIRLLLMIDVL